MKKEHFKKTITELFPEEVEIVGSTLLNELIDANVENYIVKVFTSKYGKNLDIGEIVALLTLAIQIFDTFQVHRDSKKGKNQEEVKKDELFDIIENHPEYKELKEETKHKIIEKFINETEEK